MAFAVIPVLDIKGGLAVHARGGARVRYQPLKSILHDGSRPFDIARAYRDRLGLSWLYLADLDAIAGGEPDLQLMTILADEGFDLLVDAGLRDLRDAERIVGNGSATLIVGLESIRGPDAAREILDRVGPRRVILSLDQFDGRPLVAAKDAWREDSAVRIAERVFDLGFTRLLLLDLARVGMGRGPGALDLVRQLWRSEVSRDILVGGGISGIEDIRLVRAAGASAVLVGSAFHDGRVGLPELSRLASER